MDVSRLAHVSLGSGRRSPRCGGKHRSCSRSIQRVGEGEQDRDPKQIGFDQRWTAARATRVLRRRDGVAGCRDATPRFRWEGLVSSRPYSASACDRFEHRAKVGQVVMGRRAARIGSGPSASPDRTLAYEALVQAFGDQCALWVKDASKNYKWQPFASPAPPSSP